jgi:hypothetical protein
VLAKTFKIETLKVNGMSAMTRRPITTKCLHKHKIDFILLKDVTPTDLDQITGNIPYTRETIKLTENMRLPFGKGMAVYCRGVWVLNIYGRLGHPIDRTENKFTMWSSVLDTLNISKNYHRVLF